MRQCVVMGGQRGDSALESAVLAAEGRAQRGGDSLQLWRRKPSDALQSSQAILEYRRLVAPEVWVLHQIPDLCYEELDKRRTDTTVPCCGREQPETRF